MLVKEELLKELILLLLKSTSCRYLKVDSCPGTSVNWFPSK